MAQFSFNPQQHQLQTAMERLPRGWYPAIIEASEIAPTAKKDGFRLILDFRIIDGPGKGRKIMPGYNIDNPSAKAVEISMNEIKTINYCIGNFNPIGDSQEMHNKPLQILLTEPKDSDYNEVKGYRSINGEEADKIGQGALVGHQQQPPQGFGQPAPIQPTPYPPAPVQTSPFGPTATYGAPVQQQAAPAEQVSSDGAWKLVGGQWVPNTPPAPPAPPAAPAWAAPAQQAPPAAPPAPAYAQQPPAPPAAPAWQPNGQQPAAPAWAPQR